VPDVWEAAPVRKGKSLGRKLSKQTRFAVKLARAARMLEQAVSELDEARDPWEIGPIARTLEKLRDEIADVLGPGERWPAEENPRVMVEFTKGSCPVCAKRAKREAKAEVLHPRARRRIEL
jgi:hypothetical protein